MFPAHEYCLLFSACGREALPPCSLFDRDQTVAYVLCRATVANDVFGDQDSRFKHVLLEASKYHDGITAVNNYLLNCVGPIQIRMSLS
jgi:hypothetical protein